MSDKRLVRGEIKNDQVYIQEQLRSHKSEISLKELPLDLFISGTQYFVHQCNMFYDDSNSIIALYYIFLERKDYVMIHYIGINTLFEGKIYKQKEQLMYYLDDNEYYSSLNNKYIKLGYEGVAKDKYYDENVVKLGFLIAIETNRIFILPKFSCRNSFMMKKFYNRKCSFDELFDIRSLDKYLFPYYRENVYIIFTLFQQFLNNKLVPLSVKKSHRIIYLNEVNSFKTIIDIINKENTKVVEFNFKKLNYFVKSKNSIMV